MMKSCSHAIVVLAGGAQKSTDGAWHTTLLDSDSNFGAPGSRLRVVAASILYNKKSSNSCIIASGGKGWDVNNEENRPKLSTTIKNELIDLGIPKDKIIEESKSNRTHQQLEELGSIIRNYKIQSLIVLSNEYHLARIKAIIQYYSKLKKIFENIDVRVMSAEDILLESSPKEWRDHIKQGYSGKRMRKIIKSEKRGVQQIKNGVYRFR